MLLVQKTTRINGTKRKCRLLYEEMNSEKTKKNVLASIINLQFVMTYEVKTKIDDFSGSLNLAPTPRSIRKESL